MVTIYVDSWGDSLGSSPPISDQQTQCFQDGQDDKRSLILSRFFFMFGIFWGFTPRDNPGFSAPM